MPTPNYQQAAEQADLVDAAYNLRGQSIPPDFTVDGWTAIDKYDSTNNPASFGYDAVAFQKGNQVLIVHSGTISWDDWAADFGGIGTDQPPLQALQAQLFVQRVAQATHTDASAITEVGHSLGGTIAELMAVFFGGNAYTFNGPSAHDMLAQWAIDNGKNPDDYTQQDYTNRMTNYEFGNDFVGRDFGGNRLGTNYEIPNSADKTYWDYYQESMGNGFLDPGSTASSLAQEASLQAIYNVIAQKFADHLIRDFKTTLQDLADSTNNLGTFSFAKFFQDVATSSGQSFDQVSKYYQLTAEDLWAPGTSTAPTSSTNFFAISNTVGNASQTPYYALPSGYLGGIAIDGGDYAVALNPNILNGDGLSNVAPSWFITDALRPGAAIFIGSL